MKNFEYAHPKTEAEAIQLLADRHLTTAVLAGGTDLVALMKQMIVTPQRVVNISDIESLRQIERDDDKNVWIGSAVHLDEFFSSSLTDVYPAVKQIIQAYGSLQLQAQGTIGGELLGRPCCWYFRKGAGLLANDGHMIVEGDNRYHAILGNRGPAKFVSPSRLAPAIIALGAKVRVVGPKVDQEQIVDAELLYRTPSQLDESEFSLLPGQLVTHIVLPKEHGELTAAYEVRHGEGPDQPLAAAAVCMSVAAGVVRKAQIVLGQVAPTPWIAREAARVMIGRSLNETTAELIGNHAVAGAMALSCNAYKIDLARVAVKRAILRAAGMDTGDFDSVLEESHEVSIA